VKIAILGDTHFGMRNDSAVFNELARKFYTDQFFPYCLANGIGVVIQLGDLFDRRKYVNFNTLASAKEYFFNPLIDNDMTLYTLIGNHDIFFRNTLKVNSPDLLLGEYNNIHIIDKPCEVSFMLKHGEAGILPIDFVPWICEENEKEVAEFIKNSKNAICLGHLELQGFEMDRGNFCHEGMDAGLFAKYEQVISGHFHHRSQKGNILYAGVPYQMTWADWNDPKGFHVFDTETRELEFIQNPHEIYVKINYNDDNLFFDEVQNGDYSAFTGKYLKVVVEKKSNSFLFETLIENLNKANPIDVTIVEDFTDISLIDANGDGVVDQADDTLSIIDKVVEGMEIDLQKPRLKSILKEIYNEALASES
jgi:DNA repair exonuclease SbcCD nuclease subunit